MGWASGNEVFEPVADALISTCASDQVKQTVCEALIKALLDRGWDTAEESLGLYEGNSAIVSAFETCGFYFKCFDENDNRRLWLNPHYPVEKRQSGTVEMRIERTPQGFRVWGVRGHTYNLGSGWTDGLRVVKFNPA